MLKKNEKQVVCVAQFKAKQGKEEELLEALHGLIPATRSEQGNIRYELNQAVDDRAPSPSSRSSPAKRHSTPTATRLTSRGFSITSLPSSWNHRLSLFTKRFSLSERHEEFYGYWIFPGGTGRARAGHAGIAGGLAGNGKEPRDNGGVFPRPARETAPAFQASPRAGVGGPADGGRGHRD